MKEKYCLLVLPTVSYALHSVILRSIWNCYRFKTVPLFRQPERHQIFVAPNVPFMCWVPLRNCSLLNSLLLVSNWLQIRCRAVLLAVQKTFRSVVAVGTVSETISVLAVCSASLQRSETIHLRMSSVLWRSQLEVCICCCWMKNHNASICWSIYSAWIACISWKVMEFKIQIVQALKVMESGLGPGESWKTTFNLLLYAPC